MTNVARRLTYINARHFCRSTLTPPSLRLLAFSCEKEIKMFALSQGRQSQSPLQAMLVWCRGLFKTQSESDFGCCADAEIERIAKDLRMTGSELRALARKGPGAADLLVQRMAALDLDPKEVVRLEPAAFRDLQRVCSMCKAHRQCARDFAQNAPPAKWEDYCPNTSTLAALNGMPWPARREW
jgi:Family of unknown function (DUF6455)